MLTDLKLCPLQNAQCLPNYHDKCTCQKSLVTCSNMTNRYTASKEEVSGSRRLVPKSAGLQLPLLALLMVMTQLWVKALASLSQMRGEEIKIMTFLLMEYRHPQRWASSPLHTNHCGSPERLPTYFFPPDISHIHQVSDRQLAIPIRAALRHVYCQLSVWCDSTTTTLNTPDHFVLTKTAIGDYGLATLPESRKTFSPRPVETDPSPSQK